MIIPVLMLFMKWEFEFVVTWGQYLGNMKASTLCILHLAFFVEKIGMVQESFLSWPNHLCFEEAPDNKTYSFLKNFCLLYACILEELTRQHKTVAHKIIKVLTRTLKNQFNIIITFDSKLTTMLLIRSEHWAV